MNAIVDTAAVTTRRSVRPAARKSLTRPVMAFGLAILAVGGIGAAATSAAWTDNVFFSAQAGAATFDLQGSLDGTTWMQSSGDTIELVVPSTTLANLLPGESRTVNLHVKNAGSVSAAITPSVAFASSNFVTAPTIELADVDTTIVSEGTDSFSLVVTAPADWAPTNQGKSGTVVVTIAGTAVAP